ncbi:hypothetical protein [Lacibacter sp.]|uniref:hypothetical protein n=1 Tax=Lacibacter sp. TaxID=1915409 RepID=UPI002B4ADAE5|nr:hypothetical protein [Lacibacter sp.]HLP37048.1 hypothetical protein [Lacibacter sp.]
MPCNHKFIDYLNLEHLDFEPTTLIVGTFNPEWPAGNNAEWFYGRTHHHHGNQNNNFWDVLPRLYQGEHSLINAVHADWKAFCSRKQIALTDLITTIKDADQDDPDDVALIGNYADNAIADNFHDFVFTDIISLLQNNPTINNVYITNGVNGAFWNALWTPVVHYCEENNIRSTTLLTPSKNARFSMFAHNHNNPNNQYNMANLNEYILMRWQEQWHF